MKLSIYSYKENKKKKSSKIILIKKGNTND